MNTLIPPRQMAANLKRELKKVGINAHVKTGKNYIAVSTQESIWDRRDNLQETFMLRVVSATFATLDLHRLT